MADHYNGNPPSTVAPPVSIPEADTSPLLTQPGWQCPRCGSPDMASAYLVESGDNFKWQNLKLAPRALKLPKIRRMLRPNQQLVGVSAQVCRKCGLVMPEVDPDEFAEAERKYGRR
jgi:hypothetical protein